jgi:hypothetical protein
VLRDRDGADRSAVVEIESLAQSNDSTVTLETSPLEGDLPPGAYEDAAIFIDELTEKHHDYWVTMKVEGLNGENNSSGFEIGTEVASVIAGTGTPHCNADCSVLYNGQSASHSSFWLVGGGYDPSVDGVEMKVFGGDKNHIWMKGSGWPNQVEKVTLVITREGKTTTTVLDGTDGQNVPLPCPGC